MPTFNKSIGYMTECSYISSEPEWEAGTSIKHTAMPANAPASMFEPSEKFGGRDS